MKLKKIDSRVIQDIKEMAQAIPDLWQGYSVTESITGEMILLCNMQIPKELKPINKADYYDVTFDRYKVVDSSGHYSKMMNLVKKAKDEAEAMRQIRWYVNKYTKLAKQQQII